MQRLKGDACGRLRDISRHKSPLLADVCVFWGWVFWLVAVVVLGWVWLVFAFPYREGRIIVV